MKPKKVKAYADYGPRGYVFMFSDGPVADGYPSLLQVYHRQVTPDLVPVWITPRRIKARKSK